MLHFKLVVASLCVMSVYASGYGGSKSRSGEGGYGSDGQFGSGQIIPAAIRTRHNIEFRDVPSTGSVGPTTVEVGANSIPLQILFRTSSSSLNVQPAHNGGGGEIQESQSEDEPHRLLHTVRKPIIQEVHEVITPFRKITQEIQPVQEEIQTIVARSNGQTPGSVGFEGSASFGGGASFGAGRSGGGYGGRSSGFKSGGGKSY